MSASPDPNVGKNRVVGIWTQLFAIGLWFSATYGQFLYFDLELAINTHNASVVVGLGALTSAVVIALTVNAPTVFRRANKVPFWYFSSASLMVALIAIVFLYRELAHLWTCDTSFGVSLLKGSKPTTELLKIIAEDNIECTAFERFPGNPEKLYELGSVWSRYQILALTYVFAWAILSALIISVVNCFKIGRYIR